MELFRFSTAYKKEKEIWPEKVVKAVRFLEEDYVSLQSLEELANRVELSKYHLTRLFKKTTGLSPMEYLTKVRMEKAVKLLRNTDLTIEEIARIIGYSNGSYFIKVFRWGRSRPLDPIHKGRTRDDDDALVYFPFPADVWRRAKR